MYKERCSIRQLDLRLAHDRGNVHLLHEISPFLGKQGNKDKILRDVENECQQILRGTKTILGNREDSFRILGGTSQYT